MMQNNVRKEIKKGYIGRDHHPNCFTIFMAGGGVKGGASIGETDEWGAHVAENPNLHDIFWKAAKLCSACKVEVSEQHADELMDAIKEIHDIFWKAKGREVDWVLAGG